MHNGNGKCHPKKTTKTQKGSSVIALLFL